MDDLKAKVIKFNKDRDWDQFHTPRNLATSLVLESAEVLEKFQWKLDNSLTDEDIAGLKEELADVLLYTIQLSLVLQIDVVAEAHKKIEKNAKKYPVEKAKGVATKYNKF